MESALSSFNAVAPICVVVLIGMLLRKLNVIEPDFIRTGNRVLYKAIMPVMIFNNIFFADNASDINPYFILYTCVVIIVGFAVSGFLCARFIPNRPRAAAFAQSAVRSNYLVVGLSMATSLMGEKCAASVSILTPFTSSLYAIGASLTFALFRQDGKVSVKKVFISLAQTPILWGVAAALALKMINVEIPGFLRSAIKSISGASAPLALIILGAQLDLGALGRNIGAVALCGAVKLIIMPTVLFVPAVIWMNFNAYELAALFFLLYSPCAVNGYFEALHQGADYEFSGETVVFSTLASFVTLFLAIFSMRQLGIF